MWKSFKVTTIDTSFVSILVQFGVIRKDCVVGQPYLACVTLYGQLTRVRFFHVCVQGKEIVAKQVAMSTFNLGVVMSDVGLGRSEVLVCITAHDAYPHPFHSFLRHLDCIV